MLNEKLLSAYRYHRAIDSRRTAEMCIRESRRDVMTGNARYPETQCAAVCWQEPRRIGNLPFPQYSKSGIAFVQNVDGAGLRHVMNVEPDSTRPMKQSGHGWYSDNDQNQTIHGVVYQLPGRDGKARFVAGYASSDDCDGAPTVDFSTIYEGESYWDGSPPECDAARDAARAADSMAKDAAEKEREYNAAWRAGSRYADLKGEIEETRSSIKEAIGQFRAARKALAVGDDIPGKPIGATLQERFGRLCELIRSDVADMLESIATVRAEREKLKAGESIDEWLPGFWTGNKALQSAFNDGAGETVFP